MTSSPRTRARASLAPATGARAPPGCVAARVPTCCRISSDDSSCERGERVPPRAAPHRCCRGDGCEWRPVERHAPARSQGGFCAVHRAACTRAAAPAGRGGDGGGASPGALKPASAAAERASRPAQAFFRRFYTRHSFKAHDPRHVAPACLFLAAKVRARACHGALAAKRRLRPRTHAEQGLMHATAAGGGEHGVSQSGGAGCCGVLVRTGRRCRAQCADAGAMRTGLLTRALSPRLRGRIGASLRLPDWAAHSLTVGACTGLTKLL